MKKTILLTFATIISLGQFSCTTNKHTAKYYRSHPKELQIVLDSICTEGYNLYTAEYINWITTDSVLAHYDENSIGGNIIWQPTDSTWKSVFLNSNNENCIFELNYNIHNQSLTVNYNTRPLTVAEQTLRESRETMLRKALSQFRDSLRYNSNYGRPNIDFVQVNPKITRMYILQGVEYPNIIPFGNDYSIDFDNDGNITAFRRYHNSLIAIPTVDENGKPTSSVVHSHLKNNPFITPTDICNFLLYRGSMKETMVLSTALDGYIIYVAENNSAAFITREVIQKIVSNSPKNK